MSSSRFRSSTGVGHSLGRQSGAGVKNGSDSARARWNTNISPFREYKEEFVYDGRAHGIGVELTGACDQHRPGHTPEVPEGIGVHTTSWGEMETVMEHLLSPAQVELLWQLYGHVYPADS
jgi:hypothetical protein